MNGNGVTQLLGTWNSTGPADRTCPMIEEDSREMLQSPGVRKPDLSERLQLLAVSCEVGVDVAFLGFPAASAREAYECAQMINYLRAQSRLSQPVLMARARRSDIEQVARVRDQTLDGPLTVDLYVASSPLRSFIEGWSFDRMLDQLAECVASVDALGLRARLAFEDSTRTPPSVLEQCLEVVIASGVGCVILNDTTGDCSPQGARAHVAFAADFFRRCDRSVTIGWHGHNDKGLALANSLAAWDAGADLLSGTFLGLGERCGNAPLEQMVYTLSELDPDRFAVRLLPYACQLVSEYLEVPIHAGQPLVGANAFSSGSGTHVAALQKARPLGMDFVDYAYSAVSATALGRSQKFFISPNSSRATVRAFSQQEHVQITESQISAVLAKVKRDGHQIFNDEQLATALSESGESYDESSS